MNYFYLGQYYYYYFPVVLPLCSMTIKARQAGTQTSMNTYILIQLFTKLIQTQKHCYNCTNHVDVTNNNEHLIHKITRPKRHCVMATVSWPLWRKLLLMTLFSHFLTLYKLWYLHFLHHRLQLLLCVSISLNIICGHLRYTVPRERKYCICTFSNKTNQKKAAVPIRTLYCAFCFG